MQFRRLRQVEKQTPGMIVYGCLINTRSYIITFNTKNPNLGWQSSYQNRGDETVYLGSFETREEAEQVLLEAV